MATAQKDTIYIDIDDEITAIIDKVRTSPQRIVALVLPKRAAVLQSIVNMKLLKRTAESAKKHVVLITSEAGLLPLAGAVGIHVAPTLQSKPAIPVAPEGYGSVGDEALDESGDFDPNAVADRPVGQLAGPAGLVAASANDLETIELDDDPVDVAAKSSSGATAAGLGAAGGFGAGAAAAVKKDSKLKIPDFNKFRLALILGGVAFVGLLIFGYFAVFVMPKATVTIATDSSDIQTNSNLTLDPTTATVLDIEGKVLPAKIEQKQASGSQQTTTTGQKNKGTKASGSVSMTAQICNNIVDTDTLTVPAGTGVSTDGKTFITQESTDFKIDDAKNGCINYESVNSTAVTSQTPGMSFNIGPSTFSVAGRKDVSAKSSEAFSGGTDNIVKVVAQSDIDSVRQKLAATDGTSAKADLETKLESAGYMAITGSARASDPVITPSAAVGDESDTVTVTSATTHTMYGIKKADLEKFITANVEGKIDKSKQKVLNDGVDQAKFDITSPASSGPLQVALSASSLAGPDLKIDALKKQIAGKKTNDVRTIAKATPGVTDVSVKYSPFWVSSVPKKESKITVVIEKTPATANSNGN